MLFSRTGKKQAHSTVGDFFVLVFLLLIASFMVLPFLFAMVQSLKPTEELFTFPPRFFVQNPTAKNFMDLFLRTNNMWVPLERYLFNSLLITMVGSGLSVFVCSMGAFTLSKFVFPGSRAFEKIVVMALLFVHEVTFLPQYILLSEIKLIDTMFVLIIPAIASPLGFYLMKNFMSQIPGELIDAAKVDGAGTYRTFHSVVLPNVRPAWITLFILSFQALWNRDTSSFVFTEQSKNLPALFRQISASNTVATTGIAAAAAVVLMFPPILMFLFTQNKVVETMASSGIKG